MEIKPVIAMYFFYIDQESTFDFSALLDCRIAVPHSCSRCLELL